jgi:hypothetical protein
MTRGIKNFKLVVYVPLTYADEVRNALGNAGAGVIGNYAHCSFSTRGVGRYKPLAGATPFQGQVGIFESVEEERIEVTIPEDHVKQVINALKTVHPYEEIAYDVFELVTMEF